MSEAYIGELRIFGFGYAPKSWAQCNGQTLPINQNQALFSILGTTYGGDGVTTFRLPDLRGVAPVHFNPGGGAYPLGATGGEESHTLTIGEMPAHQHVPFGSTGSATTISPVGNLLADPGNNAYAAPGTLVTMNPGVLDPFGGGQGHPNMQPYQVVNICICLFGIYPSRN